MGRRRLLRHIDALDFSFPHLSSILRANLASPLTHSFGYVSSKNSVHSATWATTTNLVEDLKRFSDEELFDRLDRLERINANARKSCRRRRSVYRPKSNGRWREYVDDDPSHSRVVALWVAYLGWDLPSFASAHPGITSTEDAILDACYGSGLAAPLTEEEKRKVEEEVVVNGDDVSDSGGNDDGIVKRSRDNASDADHKRSNSFEKEHDDDDGSGDDDDDEDLHSSRPHFDNDINDVDERRCRLGLVCCGRTDVGVSALGQVVTLRLKRASYVDNSTTDGFDSGRAEEFSYAEALNRHLPPEVRVLSWSTVPDDFSARFNCTQRSYSYQFPKGDLDLASMRAAASDLIGFRDFRNFCKVKKEMVWNLARYGDDAFSVSPFFKCVHSAEIVEKGGNAGLTMCELRISANGFLWHQIRCIVFVLLLVGQNLESPDIVRRLLDVDSVPAKPIYAMAAGFPLALSGTQFQGLDHWRVDVAELHRTRRKFQEIGADLDAKSSVADRCYRECLDQIQLAQRYELLSILKEGRKRRANPEGYDAWRSFRRGQRHPVDRRQSLSRLSKEYSILQREPEESPQDIIPYFLRDDVKRTLSQPGLDDELSASTGKDRKEHRYRPLLERSRGYSLQRRVQFCLDLVRLVNDEDASRENS